MKETTAWLPLDLVQLVDKIKEDRKDSTRRDTVRYLILRALHDMSYLSEETKKALGWRS